MPVRLPWYERWSVHLAFGLTLTLGSAYVFWQLADWEAHPDGPMSMPWPAAILYRLGGKWLVSTLVLAVGLFLTFQGLHRRRVQVRGQASPAADEP